MTTDPTAGDGRTPPGDAAPSAHAPGEHTSPGERPTGAQPASRPPAPQDPGPQPPSSGNGGDERPVPPEYTQQALPRYTQQNPPRYPPPGTQGGGRRPAGSGFFDSIRRTGLHRADRRWVGGVAAGVADRIGWDPMLVRGLLVLSFFLGGIGLVAYAAGWALMPEQSDGRIHLEEAVRGNFDVAILGAAVLLLVGFAWGGPWEWGFYGDSEWIALVFWLAVIGGVVYLLVRGFKKRPSVEGEPHALPYPAPPATSPPGQPSANGTVGYDERTAPAPGSGPAYHGPHYPVPPNGPQAGQPPHGGTPYAGHAAPRPPRPPKGGGGGIVLGLILLVGAALLLHDFVLGGGIWFLPDNTVGTFGAWTGLSLMIIGGAIVVAGLRGRSSGGLGALAIIGLVIGVPATLVYQSAPYIDERINTGQEVLEGVFDPSVDGFEPGVPITEGTASPRTTEQAEHGYSVQFGDPTIDLTDLDLSEVDPGEPVEIPISVGGGTTRVIVPEDAAIELDGRISAGVLQWNVDGDRQSFSGFESRPFQASSDELDDDDAELLLVVQVTAGEAIIEEER